MSEAGDTFVWAIVGFCLVFLSLFLLITNFFQKREEKRCKKEEEILTSQTKLPLTVSDQGNEDLFQRKDN